MTRKTAEQLLTEAARRLAGPEHEQTRRELWTFIDYWGLGSYTPPDHIEARVREVVKGVLTAAHLISAEQQSTTTETP